MTETKTLQPIAFDNERYLAEQSQAIRERIDSFGGKLYLEFGGKLLFDYHASRVLPGFDPNVKMRLLQRLKDEVEIVLCIYAADIERGKVRADFGITYDADTLKLIDDLRDWGLNVRAVVITRYTGQPAADAFRRKLERHGITSYVHQPIPGYPNDVETVVSDAGYGSNPFIETEAPLVVVNAPGPNSGKMATCLSQVYHEHRRGVTAGYAKFETFPIWNLPLKHPVNVAYEAATAELRDVNLIDPHHLEAHGETVVNYNRDVAAFPLLREILERITGDAPPYQSPTDMGVNRAGFAIIDDEAAQEAGKQEIIRRYFRYACDAAFGLEDLESVQRIETLMRQFSLRQTQRPVVGPAREMAEVARQHPDKGHQRAFVGAAMQLPDGTVIGAHNTPTVHAAGALVLLAVKTLAGLPVKLDLISQNVVDPIAHLRGEILGRREISLNLEETLIALAISSSTSPAAKVAMEQLSKLRGCEMHMTHLPTPGDEKGLRRLGVSLTCDPAMATNKLFAS
ncbi:MAG: DUF1846 domain-containing protein [bacterium]